MNELPLDWQRCEFMGLNVANERALHQILDNPKIFVDPLALRIIGPEAESRLRSTLTQFQKPAARAWRAGVTVRNRYTEDELAKSIQRGVRQYVILGAGLDTFAYRNAFPGLRVFEVDHPATQEWKRSCLDNAAIRIPESVTYVPVDFEQQVLTDPLKERGFKSDELAFLSFIGVVRYLSRAALVSVLSSLESSMRAGSEVVFDFGPPPSLRQVFRGRARPGHTQVLFDCGSTSVQQRLQELTYRTIVNWKLKKSDFQPTYFDVRAFIRDLTLIGFSDVWHFGSKEMNELYCKNRTDGLRIRNESGFRMHLVKARV